MIFWPAGGGWPELSPQTFRSKYKLANRTSGPYGSPWKCQFTIGQGPECIPIHPAPTYRVPPSGPRGGPRPVVPASPAGRQPSVTACGRRRDGGAYTPPGGARTLAAHGPPGSSRATLTRIVRAGEVPVTTGPQNPAAAGRDRVRASHADREQVIGTLKNAFVHGRADQRRTRRADGPGAHRADLRRLGRAHRRHPARPAVAGPGRPPAPARRRRWPGRPSSRASACSSRPPP